MRNLINTSAGKYVVNILMIVIFAGSAITGLFFMEGGGRPEGGRKNNHEQFSNVSLRSDRHQSRGAANFNRNAEFEGERGEGGGGSEEIHEISGIIWLVLMFLHTIQHWNWYKKLFSPKHIMQNKLLTGTLVLFVLLVLTSIGMWTEMIPRDLIDLKEIHGLIGQVLVGFVIIHIFQRAKWYVTITNKLFKKRTIAA
jgi:magnesium-transporting ATPase (P-type)